uniref:Uncharacterized protein n=1 Tax=uncultured prokaryote TaxID=198431 RepID=A0A0H5Q6U5_9ZZZZ|nr:hypothetical protein [uncultured prokaryote]
MSLSDHEYVNFSQDYELNHHLKEVGKRQTESNRSELKRMGNELKLILGVTFLTHKAFRAYINERLNRLE